MFILSDFSLFDWGKNKRWKKSIEMSNGSNVSDTRQRCVVVMNKALGGNDRIRWQRERAFQCTVARSVSDCQHFPIFPCWPAQTAWQNQQPSPFTRFYFCYLFFISASEIASRCGNVFPPAFPPKRKTGVRSSRRQKYFGMRSKKILKLFWSRHIMASNVTVIEVV